MAYGSGTETIRNTPTNDQNINAMLSENRWASKNVTYSFTDNFQNDYEPGYSITGRGHNSSFSMFSAEQQKGARDWFNQYESVSGLRFTELSGAQDRDATIRIAKSDDPSTAANPTYGYAFFPGSNVASAGDVWIDRRGNYIPVKGNLSYYLFGHEIGHALGLDHGHERSTSKMVPNVVTNRNRDSMEFSIMTYRSYIGGPETPGINEKGSYAQSLMMYDIRTIQEMYGANFDHNSGNTTYSFSTSTGEMFIDGKPQGRPVDNRIFRTIWDGNGIDTYNFSNYGTNLSIDLAPGGWSNLDMDGNHQRANLGNGNGARGHVFNALQYKGDTRSLIENAYGGQGNDSIVGNDANNHLLGNKGDDKLYGHNGNDTMAGGHGNDYLYGGWGNDILRGDHDTRSPGGSFGGNDYLYGGYGDDHLGGKGGNDTLHGEEGNDQLWGDAGDDLLYGGIGHDTLTGGTGKDTFVLSTSRNSRDIITDFDLKADLIKFASDISLDTIKIKQGIGNHIKDAFIHKGSDVLAVLTGINAHELQSRADSIFDTTSLA